MIMAIAVCLLTCDRPELTAVTVESFVRFNQGRADLTLLHADGGSQTDENCAIAEAAGFHTLIKPTQRIGQLATLKFFLREVQAQLIPWVLWLENDWESVAPVPREPFPGCYGRVGTKTVRLFGVRKFRNGKRALAGRYRIGTTDRIKWSEIPSAPGWEWGYAHWGAGGTIIKTEVLARQMATAQRLKDVITADTHLPTVRPRENIMWSIGEETTRGFQG